MASCRGPCVLVLFCTALFFHDLTASDLWSSHEARAAQNAQRMIDDHSWGLPRLYDGQFDFQKPPAYYWCVATLAELRGGTVDRWAVRLPAALAALATVLLVWGYLTARGRPLAGLIAGGVLASSIHFTSLARTGRIDMLLTAAVTATILLLLPRERNNAPGQWLLAALTIAFALLLKGPIGLALPLVVLAVWFVVCKLQHETIDRISLAGIAISALAGTLLALPWFLWANRETNGEFVQVFFWYHNVQRALGESTALGVHPWWYYVPRFTIDFLPWTPLLLVAVWRQLRDRPGDREAALGLTWLVASIGLLSLAQFKRADYLLPAFPGAAMLVGCFAERWYVHMSEHGRRIASVASGLFMSGCVIGWTWFHHTIERDQQAPREQQAFAAHIREQAPVPRELLLFRVESHLLAFHLGRPLRTVVAWDELNARIREPGPHWIITRLETVPELTEKVRARPLVVVSHSESFTSVRPRRPLVLLRTSEE